MPREKRSSDGDTRELTLADLGDDARAARKLERLVGNFFAVKLDAALRDHAQRF